MGMTITGDADHDLACLFSPYDAGRATPPQPVSPDVVAILHDLRNEIIGLREERDRHRAALYAVGYWTTLTEGAGTVLEPVCRLAREALGSPPVVHMAGCDDDRPEWRDQ